MFLNIHEDALDHIKKNEIHKKMLHNGYKISYRYFCELIKMDDFIDLSFVIAMYQSIDFKIDIIKIFRNACRKQPSLNTKENVLAFLMYCIEVNNKNEFIKYLKENKKYIDSKILLYIDIYHKVENEIKEHEILEILTLHPLTYVNQSKTNLKFLYLIYSRALINNSNLNFSKILNILEKSVVSRTSLYVEKKIDYFRDSVTLQKLIFEGRYKEAIAGITKLLDAGNKRMYANLGRIAFLDGDLEASLNYFKLALEYFKETVAEFYQDIVESYILLINGEYATSDTVKYSFPNIVSLIQRNQKKEAEILINEMVDSNYRISENELLLLVALLRSDALLLKVIRTLDLGFQHLLIKFWKKN